MKLSQLLNESHHRGKVLLAKSTGFYRRNVTDYFALVEDVDGHVEQVSVMTYCADFDGKWAQEGHWIAIKDPYLTIDRLGMTCIQVEHSSDLVFLDNLPAALQPQQSPVAEHQTFGKSAMACKEKGTASWLQWTTRRLVSHTLRD